MFLVCYVFYTGCNKSFGKVTEFEFTNICYINKNLLHCKVENIQEDFNIEKMLYENNWQSKDYYYIKDNLALVVKEQENENIITLDLYIY